MIDAVFISDLHLHPDASDINARFERFLAWVVSRTQTLYILGDFFHAWAGDDTSTAWSDGVLAQLANLNTQGVEVYFLCGNRDFLVGSQFAKQAKLTRLKEPALIELGGARVVLVHGDAYCTKDRPHQWFRRLTRNAVFPACFLKLPKKLRARLVSQVRKQSSAKNPKEMALVDVVPATLTRHLKRCQAQIVVHGHTHRPGHTVHHVLGVAYHQYVLSDWDASPSILCYNKTTGFCFERLN